MALQTSFTNLTICQHPLLNHHLATLRDINTSHEQFRNVIRRVGQIAFLEAAKTLPQSKIYVDTPICKAECMSLAKDTPIILTPILRAGLMMSEMALDWIPTASVYHVGLYRDEESLKPITYYNKLPSTIDYSNARIFVLDPMLATGGSGVAALDIIIKLGVQPKNITFVSILAAPEGVQHLLAHHPDVSIVTAALDERLNEKGYIVPGLGDAGDRAFGTL